MNPEFFAERRDILKKYFKSRLLNVALALGVVGLLLSQNIKNVDIKTSKDFIAKVIIEGVITDQKINLAKIDEIAKQDNVKAVIVEINSPGGEPSHSERIYYSLRNIASKKPVVTKMTSIACSGGFMVALAGDYIFANNTTLTGSIGVVLSTFNVKDLLEKFGVESRIFRSGHVKYFPNRFEKMSPEAEEAIQESMDSVHVFFKKLVSERRGITLDLVNELADGRAYTGIQAHEIKLVDAIYGTEKEIKDWLVENKKINPDLEINNVDVTNTSGTGNMMFTFLAEKLFNYFGYSPE